MGLRRSPLIRKTPLARTPFRSRPKRRPGLATARAEAAIRDGGCVAREYPNIDGCAGDDEFDHVADFKAMGSKGPDRADHGQTVCAHHHKDGWATSTEARSWSRDRLDRFHPTRHVDAGCRLTG